MDTALPTPPTVASLDFIKALAHDLRWRAVCALARSDYHVQELVQMLDNPYNLVSYHLRRLRDLRLVREHRSTSDARDIYYSLDVTRFRDLYQATGDAVHPSISDENHPAKTDTSRDTSNAPAHPARVLFLCTHNSARSQMAEGIMRHVAGNRVEVASAGTEVTHVRPEAIATMEAMGIDISSQHSKHLKEFIGQHWDYVVTVCDRAKESCPIFPGDPERIHWSFDDPSAVEPQDARNAAYRQTSIELTHRIRILLSLIERDAKKRQ
ncbi:MAG: ArsR family transcriptional regulator [Chloroflexia bacterium]